MVLLGSMKMPRLALKPDSSFFRKIVIGAVGARAVEGDLRALGHEIVELERGSLDTKLWKEVKRKRVRIPDLLCIRCGRRVESRAKTKLDLSMSHSPTDESRSWDFGMVDEDWLAFPVCEVKDEDYWSAGRLADVSSYWNEKDWVHWHPAQWINYFAVKAFRAVPHSRSTIKGVTEGSETSITWKATFSTRSGTVDKIDRNRMTIRRASDGHRYTWLFKGGQKPMVKEGDTVQEKQLIGSTVNSLTRAALRCPDDLPAGHISSLLRSAQRTQRFTGIKLARLRYDRTYQERIVELSQDAEEDIYVRLEGVAYLIAVCDMDAENLIRPYISSVDDQTQLEAIITLGEAATEGTVKILSGLLDDPDKPYFMRSAAAWSLSRIHSDLAYKRLVSAFSDVSIDIREEALNGVTFVGEPALAVLREGLSSEDERVVAGCAEAIRQQGLPKDLLEALIKDLDVKKSSKWTTWLVAHLSQDSTPTRIAALQEESPEVHYAISVLWSFLRSWIARRWELRPNAVLPERTEK